MKYTYLTAFFCFCLLTSQYSVGQSLSVTTADSVLSTPDAFSVHEIEAVVRNNGSAAMRIIITRDNAGLHGGHTSYFCWSGNCYSPFADESLDTLTLLPGEQNTTFKGYLDPTGVAGASRIGYTFRDLNSGAVVLLGLRYRVGITSNNIVLAKNIVFGPNPSTGSLNVDGNGNLRVYTIDGKQVADLKVRKGEALNLNALSKGTYQLQLNGHTLGRWLKQ